MRRLTPVRLIVTLGLLGITAVFILDMSGSAPRVADSNHVPVPAFAAKVPGGGTACQPVAPVPNGIGSVRLLIGSFGRPLPALSLHITGAQDRALATGGLSAGAREGYVSLPVRSHGDLSGAIRVCLHVGGSNPVVLGGDAGPAGTEVVNGKRQPGDISFTYMRPGRESWWQLLPTLDTRFGLGKASFFGDWTLPVAAVLLLAIWGASIRLIVREPQ